MSDILKFKPSEPPQSPPGQLHRLSQSLVSLPRATKYHELCRRIAKQALDLPVADWCRGLSHEGKLLRHLDQLDLTSVERWLLEAASIDELAAMVMLDAMDYFCDCLCFLTQTHDYGIGDAQFKGDFTKAIRGLPFVFRIPPGCELTMFSHQKFDEGNYGVGRILRCHLSQNFTEQKWALGDFATQAPGDYSDLGYFDVPCEIARSFKRTPIELHDEQWRMATVTATIPYRWITQAVRENEAGKERFDAAPDAEQILGVAQRAVEAVKIRFSEIGAEYREPHEE